MVHCTFRQFGRRAAGFLAVVALASLPSRGHAQVWQVAEEHKAALRIEKLRTILPAALREYDIDLWLVFDRDADDEPVNTVFASRRKPQLDPVAEFIGSDSIFQPAAFLFTADGRRIAIVSEDDSAFVRRSGIYEQLITYRYTKRNAFLDVLPLIREQVEAIDPGSIALNYSELEPLADGLSLGMYRMLERTLGEDLARRFVSAEDIVVSIAGRNTDRELAWLQQSAEISYALNHEGMGIIRPGITTERDIFNYMRWRMEQLGVEPGWDEARSPIVTVQGPRSGRIPGDEIAEPGRLVKINGGVRVNGYAVDLNLNAYVLRPGESAPPPKLLHMWETVVRATEAAVQAIRPGVRASEIDAIARRIVLDAGYEEWNYELAHALGTWIHGIGPTMAPPWPHFGRKTDMRVQVNDTYAVEPAVGAYVPELGRVVRVHVQEMVAVGPDGARYMVPPQRELLLIRPAAEGTTLPADSSRGW
jgi:Xaa-Pro dipeptidase